MCSYECSHTKKAYGTDSLWKEDPSAWRGGFLALLLQLTHHFVRIPFRSYKYIDAKTLAWLRTWTCGSFCLVVYCKPVQQSAFLVMMLIFAREVKWSSLFPQRKESRWQNLKACCVLSKKKASWMAGFEGKDQKLFSLLSPIPFV